MPCKIKKYSPKRVAALLLSPALVLLAACSPPKIEPIFTPKPSITASATPSAGETAPMGSPSPTPTILKLVNGNGEKLEKARALNPDVIGWITVPNTNIDYPILYGKDWYYNYHNINKKKDEAGSIYAYSASPGTNNTITGHNMRKAKTMFNGLHTVQDNEAKLLIRENRVWNISVFGHDFWEIFAIYETPAGEPDSTLYWNTQRLSIGEKTKARAQWLDYQLGRTEVKLDVEIKPDDVFLTIVTCGDTHEDSNRNARLYVFLKAVDK